MRTLIRSRPPKISNNIPITTTEIVKVGSLFKNKMHKVEEKKIDAKSPPFLIQAISAHQVLITSVKISPNGNKLVTGPWDKTAKIWDIESGKVVISLDDSVTMSAIFNPESDRLVTG